MEEEKVDSIYKQGFSNGYWIETGRQKGLADSQEFKDLTKIVDKIEHPTFIEGVKAGKTEAKREFIRNAYEKTNEQKHKSRENGRERD